MLLHNFLIFWVTWEMLLDMDLLTKRHTMISMYDGDISLNSTSDSFELSTNAMVKTSKP